MPEHEDIPTPREEIEMAAEESLGHPLPGPAGERLEALKKRIQYLEDRIHLVKTDQLHLLPSFTKDLAEARQQLAEWQAQKDGQN